MNEIPEQPITRVEKYLDAILKNGGGGGGSFEKLVITLTPNSEDFSGTFDASWTDITEAYFEGKLIVGHILYQGNIVETLPTVIMSDETDVFWVQFELVDPTSELYVVFALVAATPGDAYMTRLYTMASYS